MKLLARIGLPFIFIAQLALVGFAQQGVITTYAGPGSPVNGSLATGQPIDGPTSVASDGEGGFYLSVSSQNQVYRVTADGRMILVAGIGTPGFSGDGGPATSAQLNHPAGLAVDADGNLYIADTDNNRVRKVDADGVISAFAGNGTEGSKGDGHSAISAQLNHPQSLAVDSAGYVYIADTGNHCIRKVVFGIIITVAGTGAAGYAGDGDKAIDAELNRPAAVAVDAEGNLYIADTVNNGGTCKVYDGDWGMTIYEVSGKVIALSVGKIKGTSKTNINSAHFIEDWGIDGDAHAGPWHRQVSLLASESIEKIRNRGFDFKPGDFAENITTEGIDLAAVRIGDQIIIGSAVLEVTQIGKECHSKCSIFQQVGTCIMPLEGIFARVISGAEVAVGDSIKLIQKRKNPEKGQ